MQNKGVIRFFAILFALVCVFQLSFTYFSTKWDTRAKEYANGKDTEELAEILAEGNAMKETFYYDSISKAKERYFLDSIQNEVVYNFVWLRKYSYKEVKERELNLGLDLKGGMNVTMEVAVKDILKVLSGHSKNQTFNEALKLAKQKQKESNADYMTLFEESFLELDPNAKLAGVFNTIELSDRIKPSSTNSEVMAVLREETDGAIDRTFNILRTRIDRFGVAQPNIQRLQTVGRILIELPGIKNPERVRKLLQGSAKLEFWETYTFAELYNNFADANVKLREIVAHESAYETETTTEDIVGEDGEVVVTEEKTTDYKGDVVEDVVEENLLEKIGDSTVAQASAESSFEDYAAENPLFAYLQPAVYQTETGYQPGKSAMVGSAAIKDTARVNYMLAKVKDVLPRDLKLFWTNKPSKSRPEILDLVAIRVTTRDGRAPLGGDVITSAHQDVNPMDGGVEVSMSMNQEGARIWRNMTGENIGKQIAIVLDDYVYSYPNVNSEISGGRSSISGMESVEEAKDLANILKAGKLPAPARIVQEEIVGPSLGKEAISAGMYSFIFAFILVLLYMIFFYSRAGLVADIALLANIFFLFGVLASFQAVLTLPGIAGIVLTLGMAVDANVIIFERIREEMRAGKGMRLAIADGYKNAYSAIIDGNITTLLTAIVLFVFGSGPVQGFATTLIIGILSSLFTAIFITRLIFSGWLGNKKEIAFDTKMTRNWLTNANFDFIKARKVGYWISGTLIVISIVSLFTLGLNFGVDFKGGRSYIVRFDQPVNVTDVRSALQNEFGEVPEVKTFGPTTQVKITTDFLIEEEGKEIDSLIETKLWVALGSFYVDGQIEKGDFLSETGAEVEKMVGVLSSQKVGPTIAYDIKRNALLAIVFALIVIFAYIAVRFNKWQYGLAGVAALFHDALITVGLFSLLYSIMPFSMEINQAFIAAILTLIGYSINDTVIIFDRIREYTGLYPKKGMKENINNALNSTLSRTFNTSGTTIVVLLVIFIFGGEIIRGFTFALLIGVIVGTYSSLFTASPIAYDMITKRGKYKNSKEIDAATKKR